MDKYTSYKEINYFLQSQYTGANTEKCFCICHYKVMWRKSSMPLNNGIFDSLSPISETDMKVQADITTCFYPFYLKRYKTPVHSTWALWNLFTSAVNWLWRPDWRWCFHQCWFILLQAGSGYMQLMDCSEYDPASKWSPVHLSHGGVCSFTAATVWYSSSCCRDGVKLRAGNMCFTCIQGRLHDDKDSPLFFHSSPFGQRGLTCTVSSEQCSPLVLHTFVGCFPDNWQQRIHWGEAVTRGFDG